LLVVVSTAASPPAAPPPAVPLPASPPGEWWNTSYWYRQKVTVTAGSDAVPAGYSVAVTFNHQTLVDNSKSLLNGDDVRVAYWNGGGWIELDRLLDPDSSWYDNTTTIWFKLQTGIAALDSDDNYYIYYGNPSASNPPDNGFNVFLYYDDFESGDLSAWDNVWAFGPGDFITASTDLPYQGSYSLKADVDNVGPDGQATIIDDLAVPQLRLTQRGRFYLPNSFYTSDHLTLLQFADDASGWQNILALSIDQDSTLYMWNEVAGESYVRWAGPTLTFGTWHTLEMEVVISPTAGEARYWLDGVLIEDTTGINTGSGPNTKSAVGIYWSTPRDDPNIVYVDDFYGRITVANPESSGPGSEEVYDPAVMSALAEIDPIDVLTGSVGNSFAYDIAATITDIATGVNRVTVTVPGTFGDPSVTDVLVGGSSVTYTDNTSGKLISVDLDTKVTSTSNIRILFDADGPVLPDAGGQDFLSTVDDTATATPAQSPTEGNGDGDSGDNDSWNVTTTGSAGNILIVTSNESSPPQSDLDLQTYLQSQGLVVFFTDEDSSAAHWESVITANSIDAVYVSYTVGSSSIGTKPRDLSVGVVLANHDNWDGMALATNDNRTISTTTNIVDNSHFITSPFGTGSLTIFNDPAARWMAGWSFPPGAQILAQNPGDPTEGMIAAYDTGAELKSGYTAVNRRVGVFTDEDFGYWTDDAKTLVLRSLLWAGGSGAGGSPTYDVTVMPKGLGSPVLREAGTEYTQAFTVTNSGSGQGDYDLLAAELPGASFLTVDSITASGMTTGIPDSAQITGIAAGDSAIVTLWYTVASSTDGRVDTLQLVARHVGNNEVADTGWAEVEFDVPALTPIVRYWIDEAPSGQGVANLIDSEASPINMPLTYVDSVPYFDGDHGGFRHLRFNGPDGTDTGGGLVDVGGTKIDPVHGATAVTIEAKYMFEPGACSGTDERIFGISEDRGSTYGQLQIRSVIGGHTIAVLWNGQPSVSRYAIDGGGCGLTSASVVHWVVDTSEPTPQDRVRAYVGGVRQTLSLQSGNWPWQDDTIDLGAVGTRKMYIGRAYSGIATLKGRIWYVALYQGEMGDAQITANATALNSSDDNNTYAVSVIPDGAAVTQQIGSGFSQDFTVINNSSVSEDFDLFARTGPASSFLTIDSMRVSGSIQKSPPDTARVTGIVATDTAVITVWYTVASSTDGRVDTLYLQARSVSDTAQVDDGSLEVTFQATATLLGRYWFNEAPSGKSPTTVYDDQASPVNLGITYDTPVNWTVIDEHRGLGSPTPSHSAILSGNAASTKYTTNLDGATQGSFVTVAEWGSSAESQRIAGFDESGPRVAMTEVRGNGDFEFRFRTNLDTYTIYWGGGAWADSTRRVFHVVLNTDEAVQEDRIKLYMNGAPQGAGTSGSGLWPTQGETLDFGSTPTLTALNRNDFARGLNGTLYYYAVYSGVLTASEISTDASALDLDDDNITPAVAVTPDGAGPEVKQPGTDYSYEFVIENPSGILEDYDLLASTDPASSFVTVDSITFNGLSFTAPPDSARLIGLAAGVSDTITVWYTVASDTDGNVDSLYVTGRSVSDTSVTDAGFVEIEYDEPPLAPLVRYWIDEAPSGQSVPQLLDAESAPLDMPVSYPTTSPYWVGSLDGGGNRHLRFSGAGDTGGGVVDIGGTKVDAVHGATSITIEVKYMMDGGGTCSGAGERIFGISDGDTSNDGWLAVRERSGRDVLQVQWQGQTLGVYGFGSGCPITSGSVVHWVIDTNNATQGDRIRAYVDGVQQAVSALESTSFPSQGETIDLGPATRRMFVGRPHTGSRTFNGRVWYAALYQGVMTTSQITSNANAINASDDQYTYAVTVTPDGAAVTRQAGSFSYDFTLNNGSNVAEDFDLLASVGPASSFITVDSITGGGVSASAVADSTQIVGVVTGADSTVTVWYTVASSTDGRVDTLYLTGRSVSDSSQSDLGWLEVEYESITLTVTPDGADTLQLLPTGTGSPSSYTFTVTNTSAVSETFDLLAFPGDTLATVLTVDSITGDNVNGGSPGDSARTGAIASSASDTARVWFTISVGTPGALDSLFLVGRSVGQPSATDSGWVFVELAQPNIQLAKDVNPKVNPTPGTDLTYTITITNDGNTAASGVTTVDNLAPQVDFKVGSVSSSLPGGVGVTVDYSDDNGSSWIYTPASAGCGAPANYDDCVTNIRWTLTDDLSYVAPDNTGDLEFVARIK
jgi:uncharacterized repeat protein (TIGR01451 family)